MKKTSIAALPSLVLERPSPKRENLGAAVTTLAVLLALFAGYRALTGQALAFGSSILTWSFHVVAMLSWIGWIVVFPLRPKPSPGLVMGLPMDFVHRLRGAWVLAPTLTGAVTLVIALSRALETPGRWQPAAGWSLVAWVGTVVVLSSLERGFHSGFVIVRDQQEITAASRQ